MHIIKANNLPMENPTLRLDIRPVNPDSSSNPLSQFGGSVGSISSTPSIKTTSFQFVKDDLEHVSWVQIKLVWLLIVQVFSTFGEVTRVVVSDEEDFALVTFKDFIAAYFVQQYFNDYFLANNNATLLVKWMPGEENKPEPTKFSSQQGFHQASEPNKSNAPTISTFVPVKTNTIDQVQNPVTV